MSLPDLHLLQAAIRLAEIRNYSRAARKLGVQQPTLTKRILELEHVIGFQLFTRTTQFVEPTEACRQFVEEAKQCVFHAERAMHVARLVEQGARTVLHVGKSQYADPYLTSILSSLSLPLFPNLEIVLSSLPFSELESEVLLGKLDLALTMGDFDNPRITALELMCTPFFVAVSQTSDLARTEKISLAQLHRRRWVLFDRHIHPGLYDSIQQAAVREDVHATLVRHVVTAEEAAQELYTDGGDAALLTRSGAWRIARNGITMRPLLHEHLGISVKLIARADNSSRIVSEFVRTFKRRLESAHRLQLDLPLPITHVF